MIGKSTCVVVALALCAVGCKKKAGDAPQAGSAAVATGSGATTIATGSGSTASTASAGDPVWTDQPDPLREAIAKAGRDTATLAGKKQPSLIAPLIDATAAANAAFSHDAWDPAAVVTTVGNDRKALFMWVRDNTALVPYRGSLRGPVGVMMDRVGNSLDRALLLAELLEKTGLEVRLANAQLDAASIAKVGSAWGTRQRPPLASARIDDAALLETLAKIVGADPAEVRARVAKQTAATEAFAARTATRVEAHSKALVALVPATSGSAAAPEQAFVDHWWVQVRDGAAWSDLDPSLATAEPGDTIAATAATTRKPKDIGDDRRHTIAIRVIAEVWKGDRREEKVLVQTTVAPNRIFGQKISITHIPINMPEAKQILAEKDRPAAIRKALIAEKEFAPIIRVGNQPSVKYSVNDRGQLLDITAGDANTLRLGQNVQNMTKDGVGGGTGLLGDLPSGAAPPAPKRDDSARPGFTAEWLEIEIRAPGSSPVKVRRPVFDLLDGAKDRVAARPQTLADELRLDRAYALIGETELLPMFAQIPDAFVADRTVQWLVAARELLIAIASGTDVTTLGEQTAKVPLPPSSLYNLALARFKDDPAIYLDRLNVLALRERVIEKDKRITIRQSTDILANPVAVWPTAKDPRASRIAQGVRDTDLEALALVCPSGVSCSRAPSTSELYAAAGSKSWSVIDKPQGVAAGDRALGYTIVAPSDSLRTWWRVDPATGETLGMSATGGSVNAERVAQIQANVQIFLAFASLAKCMYGLTQSSGTTDEAVAAYSRCAAAAALGFAGGALGNMAGTNASIGFAIQLIGIMLG